MANDPGFSNDTCIFIEAVADDGGNHNANDVWWLSPDIDLVGPVSGRDNADAGQVNPVTVTFHRKPGTSNCIFPGDESLLVELWVANPSLLISPRLNLSSARVELIGSPVPPEGGSGTQEIDWSAPAAPPPGDPQSAGHKCLVARVYPSSDTPSTADFFVPGDQHVAQHNLCTLRSSANLFSFTVNTFGTGLFHPPLPLEPPPNAKLRAVLDLHPNNFVRDTVLSRLQTFAGFQQLTSRPLKGGFKFDLTHLHASGIVDHSQPPLLPPFPPNVDPSFEAKVALDARRISPVTFLANIQSLPRNFACIFHLMQTGLDNVVHGGLTVVVLKT